MAKRQGMKKPSNSEAIGRKKPEYYLRLKNAKIPEDDGTCGCFWPRHCAEPWNP